MPIDLLPFAAPLALLIGGAAGFVSPGRRPRILPRLAEVPAITALATAAVSAVLLVLHASGDNRTVGPHGFGLSIRSDAVSVVMFLLVSFIGWVVVRYTATYLGGEARQGRFTGWLCITLASMLLLVLSGNLIQLVLAWVATSLFLHRLLLFYPNRVAAKKFFTARLGDVALIAAAVLLAGHGANVVNDPQASGLHCSARGGYSGEVNARLPAALLNGPAVRAGLVPLGIEIPADTLFIGTLHDTTTDAVTLYGDDHPSAPHLSDIRQARVWLDAAGVIARGERTLRLPGAGGQGSLIGRSRDWAEGGLNGGWQAARRSSPRPADARRAKTWKIAPSCATMTGRPTGTSAFWSRS